jgi:hypothetical protein
MIVKPHIKKDRFAGSGWIVTQRGTLPCTGDTLAQAYDNWRHANGGGSGC